MTYVCLDIEILQIKGVLPDIDTNDGDEGEVRVLVSGGGDLEDLSLGVVALEAQKHVN